jgi:hypothetical protein
VELHNNSNNQEALYSEVDNLQEGHYLVEEVKLNPHYLEVVNRINQALDSEHQDRQSDSD